MPNFHSLRLISHGLGDFRFKTPEEVVQHYGCIQAQDIGQSTWVIGSRIENSSQKSVRDACEKGKIIRTWPMRGTLHYMDPKHVRWMLKICASKTLPGFSKRREFLGISDKDAEKALKIMEENLKGGKCLSRTELGNTLRENAIPMQTQWTYHLACYAATKGLICFGPPSEKEETFVLLDDWIPKGKELTHDEQLKELARMYIRGHGPATLDDLAWWCGLGKTECKKAISLIEDEIETTEFNGKKHYYFPVIARNSPQENDDAIHNGIKLLGGFDEYFLGYKDRSPVADIAHHRKLFTINGIFFPLILKGGKIIGSWKRVFKKDTVIITPEILSGFKVKKSELMEEAERYAKFFGYEKCEINIT